MDNAVLTRAHGNNRKNDAQQHDGAGDCLPCLSFSLLRGCSDASTSATTQS